MQQLARFLMPFADGTLALPAEGPLLLSGLADPEALGLLPRARVVVEQPLRAAHDRIATAGIKAVPEAEAMRPALAVALLSRSKVETLGRIARLAAMVGPGGLLVVDGAKTDGIDSVLKQLRPVLPAEGVQSKAHGKVAWMRVPGTLPAALADWQEAARPRPNAEGFVTAPGMFSPDATDPGTALLAEQMPALLPNGFAGLAADLGAGWGALSAALIAAAPQLEGLDLFEADFNALAAAQRNVDARRPGLPLGFHWADVAALGTGHGPYDLVVSNPPFHHGRAGDPALGEQFIAAAARILARGGLFLMVANRHLPYEARLLAEFGAVETMAETGGYKLIAARQPGRGLRHDRSPATAGRGSRRRG